MTAFKKKKEYIHVRKYGKQQTFHSTSIELSSIKHRLTIGIKLFGCSLTTCLGILGSFIGIVIATLCLSPLEKSFPGQGISGVLIITGILLTLACMCAVSPLLRHFCHYLKHAHLRKVGTMAEASVAGYKWTTSFRGPEQIDLIVVWQDPVTDQIHTYERHYTFFWELFSAKKSELFKSYYAAAYLPLLFHPRHPRYFVLEVPFVPCWYDVLW